MLRNLTMNKQKTILAILLIAITTPLSSAIDYPDQIKPGKANADVTTDSIKISNDILSLNIQRDDNSVIFKDKITGTAATANLSDLFEITLADGSTLNLTSMNITDAYAIKSIAADKTSPNLAQRFDGIQVTTIMTSKESRQ